MARTLGSLADDAAVRWGDREALTFKDRRISFRRLALEVDRVAKGLIHLGVAPGDPETGRDQPSSVPGELLVRTPYMMQRYYRKPAETARALDAEGWFHTGDMAILRPDGYLRFVGRYKDSGENVDPVEVEGYLLQQPGVTQVAVVSYPDARLSEVAVAFVRRRPGAALTADELIEACRGRIASFKISRAVIFLDELPVTSSGKIQKTVLRERAVQMLGDPRTGAGA